eukprot:7991798-Pyramimonas_sp.AAC.1
MAQDSPSWLKMVPKMLQEATNKTAPRRFEMASPLRRPGASGWADYACLFWPPPSVIMHGHRFWMGWWGLFFVSVAAASGSAGDVR